MRKPFASVFAALAVAGLIGTATHGLAQTAPAPAAKAKTPAKKATAKAQSEDGDGAAPAARKKIDPAEAQRQIDSGIKLFQDGKAEPAIQMLTSATSGGGLPPQQMGRALFYRGMAYRKANKPAQAISDLTSALWLKNGLTEADRTEALKQRSEAYREAGLPDQTDSEGRAPGVKSAKSATGETKAAAAAAPAPASSGNFLASLFGQKSPPPPPPAETAAPVTAAQAKQGEPSTSGWSSKTRATKGEQQATVAAAVAPTPPPAPAEPAPQKSSRQRAAAVSPAAAPAPAPTAKPDGKFRARVALVRTRADAEAIVARLRVQHAGAIGNAATEINEASFGNMGTFFQVRVGPFAQEADASGVCAKLKGSGLDCVPVDR